MFRVLVVSFLEYIVSAIKHCVNVFICVISHMFRIPDMDYFTKDGFYEDLVILKDILFSPLVCIVFFVYIVFKFIVHYSKIK